MILELILSTAIAQTLQGDEIYVSPQIQKIEPVENKNEDMPIHKIKKGVAKPNTSSTPSNLPLEYLKSNGRVSNNSELIQTPKGSRELFKGLKVGDSLDLTVNHSVIAFSDEKAPVVAYAPFGSLRGLKFIGESYLEPNTKRIFINFSQVVQGHTIFNFKGVGVSDQGQPGLIGKYHSREAEYFAGDFIASFTAGYFDGLIPRKTNVFGQIQEDTSVDDAVKKGLSSGALSTAERFREKLKKVPEFSELQGSFNLKVLVLEQAKSN